MQKIKPSIVLITLPLLAVLIFTRFINLSWGLPYPFHPDERNMADALLQLGCSSKFLISNFQFLKFIECFNPHFFAYGQLPLYIGYIFIQLYYLIQGKIGISTTFVEAVMALRILSAIVSVVTVYILVKIVFLITEYSSKLKVKSSKLQLLITSLVFVFSPVLIQFAHFGTTESLLILLYSSIIYVSIRYERGLLSLRRFVGVSAALCGLAIGIKVSSVTFMLLPAMILFSQNKKVPLKEIVLFILVTGLVSIVTSPFNLFSFSEFLSSMRYESAVALGEIPVFYTRQFFETIPVLFQITHILPYALGWPVFIISLAGFIFLPYTRYYNILRFAFLIVFLPQAFLYAKWTRFVAPAFPIMLVFTTLVLIQIYENISSKLKVKSSKLILNFAFYTLNFILIVPGVAYLSIYMNEDVRFTASRWIYQNIPSGSYILSETANVVDIPIAPQNYQLPITNYHYLSFNFYNLDSDPRLPAALQNAIQQADYIFVPSRRIFANHTCLEVRGSLSVVRSNESCNKLREKYPLLNLYYDELFSGKLGFKKVAEFSSNPTIKINAKTLLTFPDEQSEETWSVFDHPTIRIYQKISGK